MNYDNILTPRKRPYFKKFLKSLFGLTRKDDKIPTDPRLDGDIETLFFYLHQIRPLFISVTKRKLKLYFRYKWHIALRNIAIFIIVCGLGKYSYNQFVKPIFTKIVIIDKVSEIERDINSNPIPLDNMVFMAAMQQTESGGDYKIKNGQYLGAYQMGILARKEVGLESMPADVFLKNEVLQNWAVNEYVKRNYNYLKPLIAKYKIPSVGGIRIGNNMVTVSGLVAACHLVGFSPVKYFIESNGKDLIIDGRNLSYDGNHVHLTHYLQFNNIKLKL
jgi:hypothetical protein